MRIPVELTTLRPLASTMALISQLAATPMDQAKHAASKLTPDERHAIHRRTLDAFKAFRAGRGNIAHWRRLVDANNIAQALAHLQIASDHHDTFAKSEQALADVFLRHQAGGSWTLKAAEIGAIDDAVFVHGIQLQHCSHGELNKAETRVRNCRSAAAHGQHAPGVVVLGAARGDAA